MAGLPAKRASVWVWPPLLASDPSRGSMGAALEPMRLQLASGLAADRFEPVPSPSRLYWAEVKAPHTSGPLADVGWPKKFRARLAAMRLLRAFKVPAALKMPPP